MLSWFAPFVTLMVVVALYLVGGGSPKREAMVADLNFYLVCVLGVAIVSIVAGARFGTDWLDVGAWVVAGVAALAAVWRWRR